MGVSHQETQSRFGSSANPATELVELGNPEPVRIQDDHGRCGGDVDPHLDDRCGNQERGGVVGEVDHGCVFVVAGHPAMQDTDAHPCERGFVGEHGGGGGDGGEGAWGGCVVEGQCVRVGEVGFGGGVWFGVVDAGADDVDLAALVDFFGGALPDSAHPGGVVRGDAVGGDAGSACGHVGEGGDVEVAEDCHGDGAWDGGGGHDEHVGGVGSAGAEGVALVDAESVLFVDDDESEVGVVDVVGEYCVGADDDSGHAAGDVEERTFALCGGQGTGEEGDGGGGALCEGPVGEGAKELGEGRGVLGCEDFGGGKEYCLSVVVDDLEHCSECDECFS